MSLFKQAKEAVSVASFFEEVLGATPRHFTGSLRYNVCPECGSSEKHSGKVIVNGTGWRCHGCDERGDVVRAAHLYWGIPMVDAARQLLGECATYRRTESEMVAKAPVIRDSEALKTVIKKLKEAPKVPNGDAYKYLSLTRGIPDAVIQEAMARELFVFLPDHPAHATRWLEKHVGKDLMIKAGLWKVGKNAPSMAYHPIVSFRGGDMAIEIRIAREATKDDLKVSSHGSQSAWVWKGEEGKGILVVEGFIDFLSAVALGTKRTIMGLAGCKNYDIEWFGEPGPRDVLLALDADGPGQKATDGHTTKSGEYIPGLKKRLEDRGFRVFVHALPEGWDLNDELLSKVDPFAQ